MQEQLQQSFQVDRQYILGEYIHEKTLNADCESVFHLVSTVPNMRPDSSQLSYLQQGFKKILAKLDSYRLKNICLPVAGLLGHHRTEDVVQSFFDALIETEFEKMDVKFYVCLEEDFLDARKICIDMTERFRKAKKVYFRQQILQRGKLISLYCGFVLPFTR